MIGLERLKKEASFEKFVYGVRNTKILTMNSVAKRAWLRIQKWNFIAVDSDELDT